MKLHCGAQRHHYSMFSHAKAWFDVGRSSFKTTPYGINATCECLQNNFALIALRPKRQSVNPDPDNNDLNRRQFLVRSAKAGLSIAAAGTAGFWFHDSRGPSRSNEIATDIRLPDFSISGLGAQNEYCPWPKQSGHPPVGCKKPGRH